MVLAILIVFGLSLVCAIIGGIIGIIGEVKNGNASHVSSYPSDSDDNHWMGFDHGSGGSSERDNRSYSDPFDNHWESSFDWKDEDNDGYDDRDDGFWNEREF